MPNYFVSYDLNGAKPTHSEMDAHLEKLGPNTMRVLESVWFVKTNRSGEQLFEYVSKILLNDDGVIVIEAAHGVWANTLCGDQRLKRTWEA